MNPKKSLVLYESFFDATTDLPPQTIAKIWNALRDYLHNQEPDFGDDTAAKLAWKFIYPILEMDLKKWERARTQRKEAVNKRWQAYHANAYERIRTHTDAYERIRTHTADTVNGNVNVNVNGNVNVNKEENESTIVDSKKKVARFQKPSIEEVKAYCEERKSSVDVERWFAYYESNGWKVGKNPMKDWRAAVRTWERSDYAKPTNGNTLEQPDHSGDFFAGLKF